MQHSVKTIKLRGGDVQNKSIDVLNMRHVVGLHLQYSFITLCQIFIHFCFIKQLFYLMFSASGTFILRPNQNLADTKNILFFLVQNKLNQLSCCIYFKKFYQSVHQNFDSHTCININSLNNGRKNEADNKSLFCQLFG